jgi:hypothetical protein
MLPGRRAAPAASRHPADRLQRAKVGLMCLRPGGKPSHTRKSDPPPPSIIGPKDAKNTIQRTSFPDSFFSVVSFYAESELSRCQSWCDDRYDTGCHAYLPGMFWCYRSNTCPRQAWAWHRYRITSIFKWAWSD